MTRKLIASPNPAHLAFRPWIRKGLAAGVVGSGATLDASIRLNGVALPAVTLHMRGPGHVVGIDPALVLRTEPPPNTTSFEPNYFPFIEILVPDLPWRYSPGGPDVRGHLRPWMVLVVVRERAGVSISTDPARPLPILDIDTGAADELPALGESWAWVHAQTTATIVDGDDYALAASLNEDPGAWLCRLVCPRRLEPLTAYIACLVPAFMAGVDAVLNPDLVSAGGDAWGDTPTAAHLPLYHHWRFQTGVTGDFESLVRKLAPFVAGAEIGTRALDLSAPGGGLPASPDAVYVGALVSPSFEAPPAADPALAAALAARLAFNEDREDDPVVSLPFYGGVALGVKEPADVVLPAGTHWTVAINLDPSARAACGVGTAVVRRNQEALVAACWDEAKDLALADTLVRQASLAGRIGHVLTAPIRDSTNDGMLLQLCRPALGRVKGSSGTVLKRVRGGDVPGAMLSPALRRMTRPKGTIGRATRLAPTAARTTTRAGQLGPGGLTFAGLVKVQAPHGACSATAAALSGSLVEQTLPGPPIPVSLTSAQTELAGAAVDLRAALEHPAALVKSRLALRVTGLPEDNAPYVPHPPVAVSAKVIAIDPELLLPGVGSIPAETVSLLVVHPPTVEAMMVGANGELAAELRWREYPTDRTATFLNAFWEVGTVDIPDISTWANPLGEHLLAGAGKNLLVLLVRGEVVRRYPDATYTLVKAAWNAEEQREATSERIPVAFTGSIDSRTRFVGFVFPEANRGPRGPGGSPEPADGDPGWFLAIAQAPTGPRFGLDATPAANPDPATWDDLCWDDVTGATHVGIAAVTGELERGDLTWGSDAAHMAAITLQTPARAYLHLSAMLPKPDAMLPKPEET